MVLCPVPHVDELAGLCTPPGALGGLELADFSRGRCRHSRSALESRRDVPMRTYLRIRGNRGDEVSGEVVREQPLTVWGNGEKFLTLLCSPVKLEALVLGYLWMERVIEDPAEVVRLDVSAVDGRADVTLGRPVTLPTERILTSGCGGGITFRIDHRLFPRLHSTLRVAPERLALRMKGLFTPAIHYRVSRGIHGAALSDGDQLLVVAEDVGRHN